MRIGSQLCGVTQMFEWLFFGWVGLFVGVPVLWKCTGFCLFCYVNKRLFGIKEADHNER